MKKEEKYKKILSDIKSVKIQGATNIAIKGIEAYLISYREDKKTIKQILATRPTEPLLQNSLNIISSSKNKEETAKKILKTIKTAHKKIAINGAKLIKNNMNIYSHCHSSTVIEILKHAKKQKKKFTVYTTEVEPLLQGRQTAKDLAKAGIKTIVSPDLGAEQALKKCDLFLFGSDAFLKKGVVNKIGTSTLCKIAKNYKIPRYSCGNSLKFTNKIKIEKRNGREVWDERNKKITVLNPAFDLTKKRFLTGVISEIGILSYKEFIKKAKKNLKAS